MVVGVVGVLVATGRLLVGDLPIIVVVLLVVGVVEGFWVNEGLVMTVGLLVIGVMTVLLAVGVVVDLLLVGVVEVLLLVEQLVQPGCPHPMREILVGVVDPLDEAVGGGTVITSSVKSILGRWGLGVMGE